MASIAEQLAELRNEIAREEKRLSDLQIRAIDMRVEVANLLAEYERMVWPVQQELQEVKERIDQIRGYSDKLDIPGVAEDYVPADEQWRRLWRPTAIDKLSRKTDFKPRVDSAESPDDASLKRLYRQLALQYHPDLAPNPQTAERWTDFMRRINEAYATRDPAALRNLADALRNEPAPDAGLTQEKGLAPLPDEDELTRAKSRLQALQLAIQSVEGEIFDIEWGWEYKLKKEVDIAKGKRRDLLAEMVADLRAELDNAKRELATLQGR